MTVPVVDAVARRYPDVQLTVLSRAAFRPMFAQLPSNVRFVGVDLKQQYKGLSGLMRLYAGLSEAEKAEVYLLPKEQVTPFDFHQARRAILEKEESEELEDCLKEAYAVHYFFSDWRKQIK